MRNTKKDIRFTAKDMAVDYRSLLRFFGKLGSDPFTAKDLAVDYRSLAHLFQKPASGRTQAFRKQVNHA